MARTPRFDAPFGSLEGSRARADSGSQHPGQGGNAAGGPYASRLAAAHARADASAREAAKAGPPVGAQLASGYARERTPRSDAEGPYASRLAAAHARADADAREAAKAGPPAGAMVARAKVADSLEYAETPDPYVNGPYVANPFASGQAPFEPLPPSAHPAIAQAEAEEARLAQLDAEAREREANTGPPPGARVRTSA